MKITEPFTFWTQTVLRYATILMVVLVVTGTVAIPWPVVLAPLALSLVIGGVGIARSLAHWIEHGSKDMP